MQVWSSGVFSIHREGPLLWLRLLELTLGFPILDFHDDAPSDSAPLKLFAFCHHSRHWPRAFTFFDFLFQCLSVLKQELYHPSIELMCVLGKRPYTVILKYDQAIDLAHC
jgi:hypothetical protein